MRLAITFIVIESIIIGFFAGAFYGSYTVAKKLETATKPTITQPRSRPHVFT